MTHTNQSLNKRRQLTSLFLLVFLFFSAASHAHTIDVAKFSIDQQDCHLCQHFLDKVPQKIKLVANDVGEYSEIDVQSFIVNTTSSYYFSPQLRAPPPSF